MKLLLLSLKIGQSKLKHLFLAHLFRGCLIFARRARNGTLYSAPFEWAPPYLQPLDTMKGQAWDKRLFCLAVSDAEETFYDTDARGSSVTSLLWPTRSLRPLIEAIRLTPSSSSSR
jgi:hypothetical protein